MEHVEEEMVWTDSESDEENMLNVNDLSVLNKVNNDIIKKQKHFINYFKNINSRLKDKHLIKQMRI